MNCDDIHDELRQLHEQGLEAENVHNDTLALDCFKRGTELAESGGDKFVGHHMRWHWGFGLVRRGRFRQAAAVLTPMLWKDSPYLPDEVDCICPGMSSRELRVGTLIGYVRAVCELRVPSSAIESCLDLYRTLVEEEFSDSDDKAIYQALYYMSMACYLISRGRHRELLKHVRKGLYMVDPRYRENLVGLAAYACAETGDAAGAQRYLKRAQREHHGQQFWAQQAEIILARRSGERELAASLAEDRIYGTHDNTLFSYRHVALVMSIESELACGKLEEAKQRIVSLWRGHSRESVHQRADVTRLFAEYHLAKIRYESGDPPVDSRYAPCSDQDI